jgi:hypothetical protein
MDNKTKNAEYNNLKIPYKFDSRYVFEDSIVRIFRLLSQCKAIEQLLTNTKLPLVFSDDNSPINFEYILTEATSLDSYKEIFWLLTCKQIPTPIKISFNMTENTVDKSVLVVFEIRIIKRELVPDIYKPKIISNFEEISVDVLNNLIIKLKNDNKDIYHYESKILKFSRDKVKNIIFNLYKIMVERGYITSIKREGKLNSEGEILTIFHAKENKIIKLKINKVKFNDKNVKWLISYMPLEVDFKDYLVNFYIIKIKPDETLLSIINIYSEQIDPNIKRDLTQRKKDLFQIIEEELKKNYPE